ncbi:MAG: Gfo/Idh/MocA family oxidoreductase [Chitinophagales bacterium]|nr:Gfo/Idh/MocA family oxidoreductase [Chitinophagales bacterium]
MQTEKKINVALIGCGYWGKNLARIINEHPFTQLVVVCDQDECRANSVAASYGAIAFSTDFKITITNYNIDAVVVASPVGTHYEVVKFALHNRKHVLCEKVLSTSSAQITELIDDAKTNNLSLLVGHTFLYNSVVKYIKHAIDESHLGDLLHLTFKRTGLGPIREDVDVITDLATHDLSILTYWLGKPESITTTARSYLVSSKADIAFVQCRYPNGIIADIQVSWLNPIKQRMIEVVGSKQMMIFDDVSTTEKLKIIQTGRDYQSQVKDFGSFQLSVKDGDIIIPRISYPEPLYEEFDDFVNSIKSGVLNHMTHSVAVSVAESVESLK